MYKVTHFDQSDIAKLHDLVRQYPLATLITTGGGQTLANLIPLIWVDDGSNLGCLRGHVARANPLWQQVVAHEGLGVEQLAVFHGPNAYISPNWYATKAQTHKVVPTYNYATAQARGALRVVDDADWVLAQITALTAQQEGATPKPNPDAKQWQVSDAPADYIAANLRAIVGIELRIDAWQGKYKLSQNQPKANQQGVVHGLTQTGQGDAANWVRAINSLDGASDQANG